MKKWFGRSVFVLTVLLAISLVSLGFYMQPARQAGAAVQTPAGVELPIFMYHHMLREEARLNKYTISPTEFRADMEYLRQNGYTPVVMADLIAYAQQQVPLPPKPVVITFDDGYESFYEYAYPILQEYGFKAVFSVVGTYAEEYSKTEDHHINYSHCKWEQLKEMQESGLVEIQNHSYNLHVNQDGRHGAKMKAGESDAQYREVLLADIGKMQEASYEYLGVYPSTFTYPFGQISKQALPILKEMGFQAALICQEKLNHLTGEPEQLYHLNRFNRPHGTSLQTLLEQARAQEKRAAEQKKANN